MAELAVYQKLRRVARRFEIQIHKLQGENLFVLVDNQSVTTAPMTLDQLKIFLADLAENNQD